MSGTVGLTYPGNTCSNHEFPKTLSSASNGPDPETCAVVIPCIPQHVDAVLHVVEQLTAKAGPELESIQVVVDGPEVDIRTNISGASIVFSGGSAGASRCRNIGIRGTKADIVLFLDSDCTPSHNIISKHLSGYSKGILGVAGPVLFDEPKNPWEAAVRSTSLLAAFKPSPDALRIWWSPSANLSFRRTFLDLVAFDTDFPKRGGGEDVLIGLVATSSRCPHEDGLDRFGHQHIQGGIMYVQEAWVEHPIWHGILPVLKRFARWGWADGILSAKCREKPYLEKFVMAREWGFWHCATAITLLSTLSAIAVDIRLLVFPIFFVVTWISLFAIRNARSRRTKSEIPNSEGYPQTLLSVILEQVFFIAFDLGSILCRLRSLSIRQILSRVSYSPHQIRSIYSDQVVGVWVVALCITLLCTLIMVLCR